MPGLGTPHAQSVSEHGLRAGSLEKHAELAEECGVPAVHMALDEAVRLLECEEVEHEIPQRRRVADAVVEDTGVAWCENRVCAVGKVGDQVHDCISQPLQTQTVGERV